MYDDNMMSITCFCFFFFIIGLYIAKRAKTKKKWLLNMNCRITVSEPVKLNGQDGNPNINYKFE